MKEPAVSVQMVVDVIPNRMVSSQNIAGGVIIADCGTLEPKLYYSGTEVLKEFTKSGKITRQTDTTLIHAAAIADIMPVLLKRSYDDDGTRAGFIIYRKPIENKESSDVSFTDDTMTDEIKASLSTGVPTSINGIVVTVDKDSYFDSPDGWLSKNFEFKSDRDFNEIEIEAAGITSEYNPVESICIKDSLGNESYVPYDKIEITDIETIKVTIATKQTAGTSVLITFKEDSNLSTFYFNDLDPITFKECYFKNTEILRFKQKFNQLSSIDPMNFCIGINGVYYYNASCSDPAVIGMTGYAVEGVTPRSTTAEIFSAINKVLNDGYVDYANINNINVYSQVAYSSVTRDSENKLDNTTGASSDIINSSSEGYSFSLISRYPSSIDFSAKVGPNPENEDLMDVTVITANRVYEYSGSTDKEYVNDYGANQFIENINDYEGIPFEVHVIPDEDGNVVKSKDILQTPSIAFGKMNISLGTALDTRKAALEDLCDTETVKIAFLCPFGYPNNSYLQKMSTYSPKIWSFSPVGLYVYKDDPEAIIANRPPLSTEYSILLAPHDKSTLMTDWVVDMSLEVAYLAKVASNAAKSCEFAPMMGKDNATLSITKPSVILKKSSREKLLDARIMSLITRTSEGISYLNKNQCSGGNTILAEDQNCRMACKINRDLDTLLEPILGRFNTEETRDRVVRMIHTYFQNNILNQVYNIDSYEVICDEYNNPPEIRANNQLVVDLSVVYLNAIHKILVYHRALDVASAINNF